MQVYNSILHGGDYNPEQWFDRPEILEKDIELMKKANINFVSLGIFSWHQLEPRENEYQFEWLEQIIEKLAQNDIKVILASPSASRPAWMAKKYVETNRVNREGQRELYGNRHNHCNTSPVLREKIVQINTELSKRFANNPNVIAWHISNEINGECLCPHCEQKFREWLEAKYETIENLNKAWWNHFWGHTFNDFSEINAPFNYGDLSKPNLYLDWNRYITDNAIEFYELEKAALATFNPEIPATTNFCYGMGNNLNYPRFAQHLDFVSWDSYHEWNKDESADTSVAHWASLNFDLMRSMKKDKHLFLMESTPSTANWRPASKLKRPKMHELTSIQSLSMGTNSVGYFQIRRSRGNAEMFHSAVIDNDNSANNRIYQEVSKLGLTLTELNEILASKPQNKVAIYYDWEIKDIINFNIGPRKGLGMKYNETVEELYVELAKRNIGVDFIFPQDDDFNQYDQIILPMGYLMSEQTVDKFQTAVANGTKLYSTFFSAYVDENNIYYGTGMNDKFQQLHGIELKEFEALYDEDVNYVNLNNKRIATGHFAEIIEATTAEVISNYEQDFYANTPAITTNQYQNGQATYFATKLPASEIVEYIFPDAQIGELVIKNRYDDQAVYTFVMNFSNVEQSYEHPSVSWDVLNQCDVQNVTISPRDYVILRTSK